METEKEINEKIIEKYSERIYDEERGYLVEVIVDDERWIALEEAEEKERQKCISEIKEIIKDAVKEANEDAEKYNRFYDVYEKWSIDSEVLGIIIEKINNME